MGPGSSLGGTGVETAFRSVSAGRLQDEWLQLLVVLVHDAGVPKVRLESLLALDPGIPDLADLLTVEALPALAVHVLHEWFDVGAVHKVNESVTHIAHVLEVDG